MNGLRRNRRVLMTGGIPVWFSDEDYNRLWKLADARQVPVSRVAAELVPEIAAGIDAVVGEWFARHGDAGCRCRAAGPATLFGPAPDVPVPCADRGGR